MKHNKSQEMEKLDDSRKNKKFPVALNWRSDQHGNAHCVVTLVNVETYLQTDGEILRSEIQETVEQYESLLKNVNLEKLQAASKNKKIRLYWSLCKRLALFNERMNNMFWVQNLLSAYKRDLGLSERYLRNSISMYRNWKKSELIDGISLQYYNLINERSHSLKKIGEFKAMKQFLVKSFQKGELPARPDFQKKLNDIISGNDKK